MRKLLYATAAAAALALTSAAANAAVLVTGSTGLANPTPVALFDPVTNTWSIDFGQNPITTSPYTAAFSFTTDSSCTPGCNANFTASSSTTGASFSQALLTGTNLGAGMTFNGLNTTNPAFVSLFNVPLVSNGSYTTTFTLQNATAFTGNTTIYPVPEPATWAMMLLGFAGMGMVIRRRQRPVLAQLA